MRLYQKYLITIGVAVVIGLLVAVSEKIFFLRDTTEIIEALIDIFFVPGALIFGFGILVVATNGGTFDMLVYGIARFASLFKKEHNNVKFKTYYEYISAKHQTDRPFSYLVIVGLVFILISVIFIFVSPNFGTYFD